VSNIRSRQLGPGDEAVELACPRFLSKGAKRFFRHFSPLLAQRGSVTRLDAVGLSELAEIAAEIENLRAAVALHGVVYDCLTVTGGRMIRARPEVSMLADASRRLKAFLDAYGLTPASREGAKRG
jgi:P27 family predicted phage terminase small subunit